MKLTESWTHDDDSVSVFALPTQRVSLQLESPQLWPRVETMYDLLHVVQLIVTREELVELPKYGEFSNTVQSVSRNIEHLKTSLWVKKYVVLRGFVTRVCRVSVLDLNRFAKKYLNLNHKIKQGKKRGQKYRLPIM